MQAESVQHRGQEKSGRRRRPLLWVGLTFVVLLLCVSSCVIETYFGNYVPPWQVSALTARISHDYPGWTIERVFRDPDTGFFGFTHLALLLKWDGSKDFRIALHFRYSSGDDFRRLTLAPTIFENPHDAVGFIDLFKTDHPEPGWIVDADLLDSDLFTSAGPGGQRSGFTDYWSLPNFEASNGAIDSSTAAAAQYYWQSNNTPEGIVWAPTGQP